MATPLITLIVSLLALYLTFGTGLRGLWQHRLSFALVHFGLGFLAIHLVLQVLAYKSMTDYLIEVGAPVSEFGNQSVFGLPVWAEFTTWQYNLPGLIGLGLCLIAGGINFVDHGFAFLQRRDDAVRLEPMKMESGSLPDGGIVAQSRAQASGLPGTGIAAAGRTIRP